MHSSGGSCALLCLILFIISSVLGSTPLSSDSQSLIDGTAFTQLAGCAQGCFWTFTAPATACDVLGLEIGCPPDYCSQAQNSCYCQPARQASATNWLSGCVNSSCVGDQAVISSAVNIYANYCLAHGGTLTLPASTSASTTSSLQATLTSTPISTPTSTPTSPQTSTLPATTTPISSSKSHDTTSIIAGSTVGGIALIALIVAGGFIWKRHARANRPPTPTQVDGDGTAQSRIDKLAVQLAEREKGPGTWGSQTEVGEDSVSPLPDFAQHPVKPTRQDSVLSHSSNPTHYGAGPV